VEYKLILKLSWII